MIPGRFWSAVLLLASGLAVGWVSGLAVSPTVHIILSSVLAVLLASASAFTGVSRPQREEGKPVQLPLRLHRMNLVPLCVVIMGIAIGATVGIYARANDWLGMRPQLLIARWGELGVPRDEIARRLLGEAFSGGTAIKQKGKDADNADKGGAGSGIATHTSALFSFGVTECDVLRAAEDNQLKAKLISSSTEAAAEFAKACDDVASLRRYVEERCKKE